MIYLSFEQVIEIHDALIEKFGGLPGFRDKGLLESALAAPMLAVFGEERYKSVYDKAAAYLFCISRNHPFNDGNKRTAATAAIMFLRINAETPKYSVDEFVEVIAKVAEGSIEIHQISRYLKELCS